MRGAYSKVEGTKSFPESTAIIPSQASEIISISDWQYKMEERMGVLETHPESCNEDIPFLEEDIFSLALVHKSCSEPFFFSLAIFAIEIWLMALCLIDLLDSGNKKNPFGVPASVSVSVYMAQAFSICISVMSQRNFITSLQDLFGDFPTVILQTAPCASRSKWTCSNLARILDGVLAIIVSFILIVQSSDVLELFMNFAALAFIQEISSIAFLLVNHGYIFESLQKDTEDVKKVMVPKCVRTRSVFRTEMLITLSMVVVLGIWGMVVHMQHKGDFTSQKLVVQVSQD